MMESTVSHVFNCQRGVPIVLYVLIEYGAHNMALQRTKKEVTIFVKRRSGRSVEERVERGQF